MQIVVTDLTRFENKNIVCLAGINSDSGICVRPLVQGNERGYLSYEWVKQQNIQPGSVLSGNFQQRPNAEAPHIEDHWYTNIQVAATATSAQFLELLEDDAVNTVRTGFGSTPNDRVYVNPPAQSIMTLRLQNPSQQLRIVEDRYNAEKIKAHITDSSGFELSFTPITDLGFCDHVKVLKESDPKLKQLNAFIQAQEIVYLRIGLSRIHEAPGTSGKPGRKGYWAQLNGIYTFPNYRTDLRRYD
jgi:hypothetical protein